MKQINFPIFFFSNFFKKNYIIVYIKANKTFLFFILAAFNASRIHFILFLFVTKRIRIQPKDADPMGYGSYQLKPVCLTFYWIVQGLHKALDGFHRLGGAAVEVVGGVDDA